MTTTRSALIVGGGIGGAAAALHLSRIGWTVTVLERAASNEPVGAAILLQPNGLGVLADLGLADALERVGHRVDAVRVESTDGQPLVETKIPDGGHLLVVRRSDLARVLGDAMEEAPGVTVVHSATVTWVERSGVVRWTEPDGDHSEGATLVIGADGVHSVVRSHGHFGAKVTGIGSVYLRFLVDDPALGVDGEIWTGLGLFGGAALVDGAYVYADATAPPVKAAVEARDLARLTEVWAAELPRSRAAFEALDSFDQLLVNDVATVRCDTFVDGRLVLLGDAAHAMEPTLGQGANSAMVDAAFLARVLTDAPDLDRALARYDLTRRPAVTEVQRDATRLAKMARLRNGLARTARDAALRVAGRNPAAAEKRFRKLQQTP